eukprot:COSAG01_NODE_11290_length_1965_cov_1.978564_2_plen_184_part_00
MSLLPAPRPARALTPCVYNVVCQAPVTNSQGITKDVSLHEVALEGLPAGYSLSYVQWAPRGGGLAFMARRTDEPAADYELWHADWAHSGKRSCRARRLLPHRRFVSAGHVIAHHRPLITVHRLPCTVDSATPPPPLRILALPHLTPSPTGVRVRVLGCGAERSDRAALRVLARRPRAAGARGT